MSSIIGIIGTVLGGVDLVALISLMLFYKPNRQSKDIDNDVKASDNLQKLVLTLETQIEIKDNKIKEQETKIDSLIKDCFDKDKQISELQIQHTYDCFWKCDVKGCINREPPNGM